MRGVYQRKMLEVRGAFEAGGASGAATIAARAAALDELVNGLWAQAVERDSRLGSGIALVAVGGYGRRELFPYSDVDLLFLLDGQDGGEGCQRRDPAGEPGDVGLRDSGFAGDAESWRSARSSIRRMRSLRCRCWITGW